MKALFLSSMILFGGFAAFSQGLPYTRLGCATMPLTTTYLLMETAAEYELRMIHHNGLRFAPVHRGLITENDLEHLAKKAQILREMGPNASIRFEKSECTQQGEIWSCFRRGNVRVGGIELQNPAFRLTPRRIVTDLVDFSMHEAELSFRREGLAYSYPMEYSPRDCVFHRPLP